jgi:HEPN domain-containing protein
MKSYVNEEPSERKGHSPDYWLERVQSDLSAASANLKEGEEDVAVFHLGIAKRALGHAIDLLGGIVDD